MKGSIFGNLGRDPELQYSQSGVAICKFSLAVNRKKDGQPVTDWWNCTAFRKTAELIGTYAKKGSKLLVYGTAQVEVYEKDGQKRSSVIVLVDDVRFADSREPGQQPAAQPVAVGAGYDDEPPF